MIIVVLINKEQGGKMKKALLLIMSSIFIVGYTGIADAAPRVVLLEEAYWSR